MQVANPAAITIMRPLDAGPHDANDTLGGPQSSPRDVIPFARAERFAGFFTCADLRRFRML